MNACPYKPEELLPHAPPMVLVDRVVEWEDQSIVTALTIGPSTPFLDSGRGVPAHVGLEWMAQTCGLFAGLESKAKSEPIRLGFLLGTRSYQATRPYFPEGDSLTVAALLVLREGDMAVFDCRIRAADRCEVASAQLTLYQPKDAGSILSNHAIG
jgi:predicted hotdog family 3-hydroxylacyl-ACP dehydratase